MALVFIQPRFNLRQRLRGLASHDVDTQRPDKA